LKSLRDLAAAFSYFSILPVGHADEGYTDGAIAWLPFVGLIIGVLSGAGTLAMWLLTGDSGIATITAWILSILLSGAIHVDGFLDCCDGLFAMATPERRLEIMRDPHHGTYAVVGMVMASACWLYALAAFPTRLLPFAIVFAAVVSRWAAICGKFRFAIVPGFVIATALALFVAYVGYPRLAVEIVLWVAITLAVAVIVEVFARSRLGGKLTGDCYGAAIVLSEIALLMISAVSTSLGPGRFR
jgi:adenosylcobinamide-GDP ribazoletransferase